MINVQHIDDSTSLMVTTAIKEGAVYAQGDTYSGGTASDNEGNSMEVNGGDAEKGMTPNTFGGHAQALPTIYPSADCGDAEVSSSIDTYNGGGASVSSSVNGKGNLPAWVDYTGLRLGLYHINTDRNYDLPLCIGDVGEHRAILQLIMDAGMPTSQYHYEIYTDGCALAAGIMQVESKEKTVIATYYDGEHKIKVTYERDDA